MIMFNMIRSKIYNDSNDYWAQFLQKHNGKNQESKYLKIYNAYTNSYKKILQLSILYL